MKIAYMHYHLKTGGVTTVIKQQLATVAQDTDQLVITGQAPQAQLAVHTVHVPELSYNSEHVGDIRALDVAQTVLKAIRSKFDGLCDILHVHNPTLAKNRYFLTILKYLQQEGLNLLLQIHDFAEDGRPLAYFSEDYPANCHYAVINRRDYQILLNAGLHPEGLHLMENTVSIPRIPQRFSAKTPIVLYPVRAIRRKNIGEAVLLSRFLRSGKKLAITLPPNSPADIKSYRGWKNFVRDYKFNVAFDQSLRHDFKALISSATSMISTSIAEGFGFSFLEPWLFGKLLWGRKIPDICRDFEKNGIQLEHLYSALRIPTDWIDLEQFHDRWHASLSSASALFKVRLEKAHLRDAFDSMTSDGLIDFGLLDESSQKMAILELVSQPRQLSRLIGINPFLAEPDELPGRKNLITTNQQAILRKYTPSAYRENLMQIYRKVSATAVKQKIDKSKLVSSFLNVKNFSLLKWSQDPGGT